MNRPRKTDKHLPRCVYQRHGAYWLVRKGRWRRLGSTLAEALAAYAALYEAQAAGGMPRLIADAMLGILPKVSPSSARQYKAAARRLTEVFSEFQPEQVRPVHVAALVASYRDKPNMGNRVLSVLRQVFDYALERRIVESNPCVGIKRNPEAKRTRLLTEAELAAIYAASGERLRIVIDLAARTGQRIGDVLALRRDQVTTEGLRFRQQKTGAQLVIRWTPELREAVERAKAIGGKVRALTLLHNRAGKAPDYRTVRDQWERACRKAGVADAHLHDLRAYAATVVRRQGGDPTAMLGHTTAANTARYLRDREAQVTQGASIGHLWTIGRK